MYVGECAVEVQVHQNTCCIVPGRPVAKSVIFRRDFMHNGGKHRLANEPFCCTGRIINKDDISKKGDYIPVGTKLLFA
jgi:collagenase-like PrtC family protease